MEGFRPFAKEKALIHFRIRTHGETNTENCHPFTVNENVVFIHNGIINNVTAKGAESDTIVFNTQYLQSIVRNFGEQALKNPTVQALIEHFIGYSKLAFFIKGEKDFVIYNKSMGNESKDGIWFSNLGWLPPKPYVAPVQEHIPYQYKKPPKEYYTDNLIPLKEFKRVEVPTVHHTNGVFSFGTLVRTKTEIKTEKGTVPIGAVGEINRVYNDRTVDIDFYDAAGNVENVYPFALEIIETTDNFLYQ